MGRGPGNPEISGLVVGFPVFQILYYYYYIYINKAVLETTLP